MKMEVEFCFKPYYNWNTFNTDCDKLNQLYTLEVLNLIITGIPSIHKVSVMLVRLELAF